MARTPEHAKSRVSGSGCGSGGENAHGSTTCRVIHPIATSTTAGAHALRQSFSHGPMPPLSGALAKFTSCNIFLVLCCCAEPFPRLTLLCYSRLPPCAVVLKPSVALCCCAEALPCLVLLC